MAERLRAAIIGVGRIGSRFDEETGRERIWTHTGAYLAHPDIFELVGAVECDPGNREAFRKRCPDINLFDNVPAMIATANPQVISICTPLDSHHDVMMESLQARALRVLWCEKPLAGTLAEGEAMVNACRNARVPIFVSHVRRWTPIWQRMRDLIDEGAIGRLRCLRIAMPNRLYSVGSHAIDLTLMLGGKASGVKWLDVPELAEEGEPARAALIGLANGAYAILQVTGRKNNLIVEAEALGDDGRICVREDTRQLVLETFQSDDRHAGYNVLADTRVETLDTMETVSPFTAIAADIAALHRGDIARPRCNGEDALAVQAVLEQMSGTTATAPSNQKLAS